MTNVREGRESPLACLIISGHVDSFRDRTGVSISHKRVVNYHSARTFGLAEC
jgi:hypothetical protein